MDRIDRAHESGVRREEAEADVDLHIAVYEASHNLVVSAHDAGVVRPCSVRCVIENRETLFSRPETRDQLRAQHRAIFESVMAGNAEEAANAAEAHVHYTHHALSEIKASESASSGIVAQAEWGSGFDTAESRAIGSDQRSKAFDAS